MISSVRLVFLIPKLEPFITKSNITKVPRGTCKRFFINCYGKANIMMLGPIVRPNAHHKCTFHIEQSFCDHIMYCAAVVLRLNLYILLYMYVGNQS
jgi:hypothetical protein